MDMMNKMKLDLIPKNLLIIDDEENMRHILTEMLSKSDFIIDSAADGTEGLRKVKTSHYDIILCDVKMPRLDGIDFLKKAGERISQSTVIMMSAYGTIDLAVKAIKLGAYDFISKPFKGDEIRLVIGKAEERDRLKRENLRLKKQIEEIESHYSFGNMVGKSREMQSVFELAAKVARFNTTVLITGESGTGKELVAKGIHHLSNRSEKTLIPINCGGIPENLLESELFGHKRGAFTGAEQDRKGLFEEADGGTLFLDEIGELPLPLQVKLLRVLQDNQIRPIGTSTVKEVDVRIIAATSKQLNVEIKNARFREDLYYRLNVLPIAIPPLRERKEDIPLLCRHFINRFNKSLGRCIEGISPSAMNLLFEYTWHGNVRELENVVERAMILAEDKVLVPDNFSVDLKQYSDFSDANEILSGYSLKDAQKVLERKMIIKALKSTDGNRTRAAKLLEISHPSLLSKMKLYDISL